jgi:hypothetical protein
MFPMLHLDTVFSQACESAGIRGKRPDVSLDPNPSSNRFLRSSKARSEHYTKMGLSTGHEPRLDPPLIQGVEESG